MSTRQIQGTKCRPGDYRLQAPSDALAEERLASILDQYMIDLEEGRRSGPEHLYESHPEFANELRTYLSGIDLVRCFSAGSVGATQSTVAQWTDSQLIGRAAPTEFSSARTSSNRSSSQPVPSSSHARSFLGSSLATFTDSKTLATIPFLGDRERLGDYRLGQVIGQGAMGVVYKARDMRRNENVAVKVLTDHGSLDASRIDRFRREAKTAASLDHPNLVPVYSVGCSQGLHYYAMQFIDGESLDRRITATRILGQRGTEMRRSKCDSLVRSAAPLVGRDRYCRIAQMGSSAASALHAAHVAGVIHRDIKPSNLVLGHDGQLWLTDFGLARVLTEAGLTRTGELVGTIRYMSPEQAAGQGDLIDARTDVYALGLTLYELVTLTQAYASDDPMQILQAIRSTEPLPPRALDSSIPYDLEVIILRAMRPRPADRYPTAAAMAADLQRFVAGKPILAHSVTWTERGISWVRNHRQLALALVTACVLAVLMSLVATYMIIREQAQTLRALHVKERHYTQARRAVDTLGADVARRLADFPEAASLRLDVLAETMQYYQQFIEDAANDPSLRFDVADSKLEIARLTAMSETKTMKIVQAYQHAAEAYETAIRISTKDPPMLEMAHLEYAMLLNEWAMILSVDGDQAAAVEKLRRALGKLSSEHVGLAHTTQSQFRRALTLNNLGVVAIRAHDIERGKAALQDAIDTLQTLSNHSNIPANAGAELADALSNLSVLLQEAGQDLEAANAAEQSLRLRMQIVAKEDAEQQGRIAITCNNLATLHWNMSNPEQAIACYRRAVTLLESAIETSPQQLSARNRLSITLNNLGMALSSIAAKPEAERAFRQAESLARTALNALPTDRQAAQQLATIQNNLGLLLQQLGRTEEAELLLLEARQTCGADWFPSDSLETARPLR